MDLPVRHTMFRLRVGLVCLASRDLQPVEKCHPGISQSRQVRSKAPHGSQNNDLRRYFVITSM